MEIIGMYCREYKFDTPHGKGKGWRCISGGNIAQDAVRAFIDSQNQKTLTGDPEGGNNFGTSVSLALPFGGDYAAGEDIFTKDKNRYSQMPQELQAECKYSLEELEEIRQQLSPEDFKDFLKNEGINTGTYKLYGGQVADETNSFKVAPLPWYFVERFPSGEATYKDIKTGKELTGEPLEKAMGEKPTSRQLQETQKLLANNGIGKLPAIEPYYEIKNGGQLKHVAKRTGISLETLEALNPNLKGKNLTKGQVVRLV